MNNFSKIEKALHKFSLNDSESIIEKYLSDNEFVMQWFLNSSCNLSCSYCHNYSKTNFIPSFTSEHISKMFEQTGKSWFINITGGEPFLYPGFINLIKLLTENNYIAINTNLCSPLIKEFSNEISNAKIPGINASFHFNELEKITNGVDLFIKNALLLQEKGFHIIVSIVAYPPIISELENIIKMLKNKGIKRVSIRSFFGDYDKKKYPYSYSVDEIKFIKKSTLEPLAFDFDFIETSFKGRICSAGTNYFLMNPAGVVYRCTSVNQEYGNLFQGTFQPENSTLKCPVDTCQCSFEGMMASKKSKSFFSKLIS